MQEADLFLFLANRKISVIHLECIIASKAIYVLYFAVENYLNRKYLYLVNETEERKDKIYLGKRQLWYVLSI